MAEPNAVRASFDGLAPLSIPAWRSLGVRITPLQRSQPLLKQVYGISACEAGLLPETDRISRYMCLDPAQRMSAAYSPSQDDLVALEAVLRRAALSVESRILFGLDAQPVIESGSGRYLPFLPPSPSAEGTSTGDVLGLLRGAGVHQLMSFPVARFNGVALPPGMSIRFADPARWFQAGAMESRLFTISTNGKQYYAWDAHSPVGKTPHDFYHVNQKGMYSLFGQSDHAALAGTQLVQAKQLRYLKIGGRVFLVVGVAVDTMRMGQAAVQSHRQGSVKPLAAQTVRTAGSLAMAWAGAKAGIAAGGLAGVETGPGMVLTAIGGGLIGGTAGYFGADWIADWIYED
jgi:hypothetical protein